MKGRFIKRYVAAAVVAALALWILIRGVPGKVSQPKVAASNSEDTTKFNWAAAGIDVRYPAGWSLLSWTSSSEKSPSLELISPRGTSQFQPYYCVDLSLNDPMSGAYQLRDGEITDSLQNGFFIYQRFLEVGKAEMLEAWLTDGQLDSSVLLKNGDYLSAEIIYRCLAGDAEIPTLDATEQQTGSDYQDSLRVLAEIASATAASSP